MLEKRRRAVQFSKAGLEMPHSDQPFKSQTVMMLLAKWNLI